MVALVDEGYVRVRPNGPPGDVGRSVWSWVRIGTGAAVVPVGIGILACLALARLVAVVVAWLSSVTHLLVLPAAPVWGLCGIAVTVVVIYALTVHDRELDQR